MRDVVFTSKGEPFRIHEPSLEEYIQLSPRLVTPIYPKDASLIVSLLDLHPTSHTEGDNESPLEIFEAGTGHGSLTLYLSRAIHGANSHPPSIPPLVAKSQHVSGQTIEPAQSTAEQDVVEAQKSGVPGEKLSTNNVPQLRILETPADEQGGEEGYTEEKRAAYEQWLTTRRAIIQTLDISAQHSKHAQQIVRSYRRGLYYGNVNFHVGTIHEYLSTRLDNEQEPFLQHAILDLPDTITHMEIVGQALKPNGLLLLFCPNITQINESVQFVRENKLPFLLDNVLEIGGATGSGGREWDVKMVKPRALIKEEAREKLLSPDERPLAIDKNSGELEDGQETSKEIPESGAEMSAKDEAAAAGWNMVCHPKFGARITVGAFVAVWRRMEQ